MVFWPVRSCPCRLSVAGDPSLSFSESLVPNGKSSVVYAFASVVQRDLYSVLY